ncbi:MAG: 3-oxoacyl-[acyl-carrier-protein] synthase III C-terminal domain-containing protein [Acidobacteriota bacterium]
MGTRIEAAATAHRLGHLWGRGAVHLTDLAANACLRHAHHDADELDLLINAGMYKNHEIAEPALASIIQEDIGANPGHPPRLGHHGTFSFDVVDGACGVLTAAQLVDSYVGHGAAKLGMIVAADVDPAPHTSRGYPFAPAGGALLIANAEGDRGFVKFARRTFPEHAALFESHLRWDPHAGLAHRGKNVLEVFEAPEFATRCVEDAAVVTRALLEEVDVPVARVDLLIASQYPRAFAAQLARALDIAPDRVPRVATTLEATHTAGPIAALEAAIESGAFRRAHHVLFVTAGSGLSVSAALYRA